VIAAERAVRHGAGGQRAPLAAGDELAAGDRVETDAPGAAAIIELGEGARLRLHAHSALASLSLDDAARPDGGRPRVRAVLDRGALGVEISSTPRTDLLVVAAQGEAWVTAAAVAPARFEVSSTIVATRVDVSAGEVSVRRFQDGRTIGLAAGRYAVISETAALAAFSRSGPALLVGNGPQAEEADAPYVARLRRLGLEVVQIQDSALARADLDGKALIFVSPSSQATDIRVDLRDLPVPLVNAEYTYVDDLGMMPRSPRPSDDVEGQSRVVVVDPRHPIAAGLAGEVQVTSVEDNFAVARPGPLAQIVATLPGPAQGVAVFAFERGAPLHRALAPARRVNLFFQHKTARRLTEDGWRLFDGAVRWVLGQSG
jgi:hypothetical protein